MSAHRGGDEPSRASAPRVTRVRKRDGRVVPFQVEKITAAIAGAMAATGDHETGFASEVASVVELTLAGEGKKPLAGGQPQVPEIEDIQDLVERALMELGRPQVAKAYILYRDRRARIREALRVHRSDALRTPIRVRETEGVSTWSKGRLVAALIDEAELPRDGAVEIAAGVERRVFASGLTRITTGLIRELVAGELLERGWTHALASLGVIGLARHDLRQVLAGRPLDEWERAALVPAARTPARPAFADPVADATGYAEPGDAVAGEVLRRFALEEIVPGGVGELHRAGDLHIEDLRTVHRPLTLCVEAELLASGGHSVASAQAVLDGAADLARRVSRVLVLERPADVLAPLARAARPGSPLGLVGFLRSLAAVARASGARIDLGACGPRFTSFTAKLVEALAELPAGRFAPHIYLDGHELEDVLAENARSPTFALAVDRLMGDGRLCSTWGEADEAFAGPGCHRRRREPGIVSCGGAIALNLPRLARRGGAWREDLVQSGIAELVQAALEVAGALDSFQRTNDTDRALGFHARRSWAIVPVGLREALLFLGDGTIDPDQGARLLGLVAEASSRFALGAVTPVVPVAPCPFFGERAARRFAWLDERGQRQDGAEQRWLFSDAEVEQHARGALRPYTADLRLSPVAGTGAGRHEAEALRTLPTGALSLAGLPGLAAADDETPYLSAWRRFEVLRRARSGEVVLELFPRRASAPHALAPGDDAAPSFDPDRDRPSPAPSPLNPA